MNTLHLQTTIEEDGKLRVEVPSGLPPGTTEVVIVVAPGSGAKKCSWREFYGVGKEIWQGEDAQEYVNRLRSE